MRMLHEYAPVNRIHRQVGFRNDKLVEDPADALGGSRKWAAKEIWNV
jgi:hypothetical protein